MRHDSPVIPILERLVSFDTTSRNSNLPIVDYIEDYLRGYGIVPQRFVSEAGDKANIWATIGPPDVSGVVLSAHMDVVPVDGQDWLSNPFELAHRDGKLYGRGAADMKGFISACLATVPAMAERQLKIPVHLAFTYDEEISCAGIKALLPRLNSLCATPSGCIVGEPTLMELVTGHKSKRTIVVKVVGHAVHSSRAPDGVNAISIAARVISRLDEIGAELANSGPRDDLFDVPFTTVHVGTISGGVALNTVPDSCTFVCEIRALPQTDVDEIIRNIESFCWRELEPEMKKKSDSAGVSVEVRSALRPLDTPADASLTLLVKRLIGRDGHTKVAFGSEAGHYLAAGIPAVICGPGSIEQAHKPNEFIEVEQLLSAERMIQSLASYCSKEQRI